MITVHRCRRGRVSVSWAAVSLKHRTGQKDALASGEQCKREMLNGMRRLTIFLTAIRHSATFPRTERAIEYALCLVLRQRHRNGILNVLAQDVVISLFFRVEFQNAILPTAEPQKWLGLRHLPRLEILSTAAQRKRSELAWPCKT